MKTGGRWMRLFRILTASILTVGLVVFLVKLASPEKLLSVLSGIKLMPLIAAFAVYMSNNFTRVGRFRAAGAKAGFGSLYAVASVHALLVRTLPLRSGDLAYAPLLKAVGGGGLATGFAGLIVMRLIDLVVVLIAGLMFLGSGLLPGGRPEWQGIILLAIGAAIVLGLYFYIEKAGRGAIGAVRFIAQKAGMRRLENLNEKLDIAAQELWRIRRAPTSEKIKLFMLTIIYWIHIGFLYYFALWALGLKLSLNGALSVVIFGVAGSMIPLSAIGTFGFQEAGFTLGLLLAGCQQNEAAALGISVSMVILIASVIPAVPCGVWLWLRKKS